MKTRWHNNLTYRLEMSVIRLRDLFRSPARVLLDIAVRPGMTVLDFGCGPGGFSLAAARLVGPQGRVYAIDVEPLALKSVRRAAARAGLTNLHAISPDVMAEVPAESVDVVLLYDVLHGNPEADSTHSILQSLHRVLKPAGVLSVSDHHVKEAPLLSIVTGGGLFRFARGGPRTFQFEKLTLSEVLP